MSYAPVEDGSETNYYLYDANSNVVQTVDEGGVIVASLRVEWPVVVSRRYEILTSIALSARGRSSLLSGDVVI